jgi:hypothetical protein
VLGAPPADAFQRVECADSARQFTGILSTDMD